MNVLVEFTITEAEDLLAGRTTDDARTAERKIAKGIAIETGETRDQVEDRLALEAYADPGREAA
jgi:hypothetical protein